MRKTRSTAPDKWFEAPRLRKGILCVRCGRERQTNPNRGQVPKKLCISCTSVVTPDEREMWEA